MPIAWHPKSLKDGGIFASHKIQKKKKVYNQFWLSNVLVHVSSTQYDLIKYKNLYEFYQYFEPKFVDCFGEQFRTIWHRKP